MDTVKVKIIKTTDFQEISHRQTFDGFMYKYILRIQISVFVSTLELSYNEALALSRYEYEETKRFDDEYDFLPDFEPVEYLHRDLKELDDLKLHTFVYASPEEKVPFNINSVLNGYTNPMEEIRSSISNKLKEAKADYERRVREIKEEGEKELIKFWEDKFTSGLCVYNAMHPLFGKPLDWAFEKESSVIFVNCIKDNSFDLSNFWSFVAKYSIEQEQKLRRIINKIDSLEDIDAVYRKMRRFYIETKKHPICGWEINTLWRALCLSIIDNQCDKVEYYAYLLAQKVVLGREYFNWGEYIGDNFYYVDLVALIYNSEILKLDSDERSIKNYETTLLKDIINIRKHLNSSIVEKLKSCVTKAYRENNSHVPLYYYEESWDNDHQLEDMIQRRESPEVEEEEFEDFPF